MEGLTDRVYDLITSASSSVGNPFDVLKSAASGFKNAETFLLEAALKAGTDAVAGRAWCLDDSIQMATQMLARRADYLTPGPLKDSFDSLPEAAREAARSAWEGAEAVVADYDSKFPVLDVIVKMHPSQGWANLTVPYVNASNEVGLAFYDSWGNFLGSAEELGYKVKRFNETNVIPYKHAQIRGSIDYDALYSKFDEAFAEVGKRARLRISLANSTSFFDYGKPKFKNKRQREQ